MIQVSLNEVKSGQQLARAVFGPKGEVLLSSGFQLTPDVVRKLGALSDVGQKSFWVYEEGLKDIKPPVLVSDITRHNLVLGLKDTCEALYNRLASDQEHDLDFYLKNPAAARALLDLTVLRRLLKETLRELNRVNPPLLNLTGIAGSGLTFYENAVDAVITAVIIAKRYAYADNEVEDLAMGTLLCDIGYFFLPEKLRNRNHRISFAEFCLLKEHPVLGFELLKDNPLLPLVAAHVVLQHHERQDGGGYPNRLRGTNEAPLKRDVPNKKQMQRYAEITAVAYRYVELLYPQDASNAKTPLQALKFILKASGSELNSHIVDTLVTMIPVFGIGARIKIVKDPDAQMIGATGVVAEPNNVQQNRPTIVLLYDAQGNAMPHQRLSLADYTDTYVEEYLPVQGAE